jgi:SAM-dependent methyltransferase
VDRRGVSGLSRSRLLSLLRCVECAEDDPLTPDLDEAALRCGHGHAFAVVGGIPRLLRAAVREALSGARSPDPTTRVKERTAASFGYEWHHFAELRPEWERNFLAYMAPHGPESFRGKLVLDAGCGTGRHAHYAARYGADVVAADLGPAIEVAHRNTVMTGTALAVQADLYDLPFAEDTFDLVYSLGVLHHLPDPEGALREMLRVVRPGGELKIYVYWKRRGLVSRPLLAMVSAARAITTRLPHPVLHVLAYPAAVAALLLFVIPARVLAWVPGLRERARALPLAGYMDYPFMVLVNDQFDRFSAPLERRYTASEVREWLEREGLSSVYVRPNYGWVAGGRKPV